MDYTLHAYETAPLTVEKLKEYLQREESIIEVRKSRDGGQSLENRYFHGVEVHEARVKVLKLRIAYLTSTVINAAKAMDAK